MNKIGVLELSVFKDNMISRRLEAANMEHQNATSNERPGTCDKTLRSPNTRFVSTSDKIGEFIYKDINTKAKNVVTLKKELSDSFKGGSTCPFSWIRHWVFAP
ncbi:unnamed protein product [Leptosia nina]|uniref:Uncharacterized protein n=1 Tax=Leptosia nina TaxID=320188 RepID=A0AAV1J8M0_9NEOP